MKLHYTSIQKATHLSTPEIIEQALDLFYEKLVLNEEKKKIANRSHILAALTDKLYHGRILSTVCRDFRTYRWKNHKTFQNLLLPDSRCSLP
jgi:hypothetical protein